MQVQSKAEDGVVEKLSYCARGPFRIVKGLGFNSFEVQPWHDSSAATRKYKGVVLYLLPPALFAHDPLDTTDVQFLNYELAPIKSGMKRNLRIELQNAQFFEKINTKLDDPVTNQPSNNIATKAFKPHLLPEYPSIQKLLQDKDNPVPIEMSSIPLQPLSPS